MRKKIDLHVLNLKPGDFAILLIILILIFLTFPYNLFSKADDSSKTVQIKTDEKLYEYPLLKDGIYEIKGRIGITKVQIKDGKVCIIDSPCPNKTCVKQGESHNIICLPNGVIVSVKQGDSFDAIAQ